MITRQSFPAYAGTWDPALPPPLCFTAPAGNKRATGPLYVGGGLGVSLGTEHLMMDPSDPTTWQRPYRFT